MDVYSNVNVPGYRVGRFQFQSGLLKLTDEVDKETFKRLLAQLPDNERANIVLVSEEVYTFPPEWILRLDLLLQEIATQGPEAQATARANLGITGGGGGGVTDGDKGDIVVSGGGAAWNFDPSVVTTFARLLLASIGDSDARATLGLGTAATQPIAAFTPGSHVGTGGGEHAAVIAGGANGFMTGADKTKLNGIATGATANSTDAALRDRSTHTGTQAVATLSFAASQRLLGRNTAGAGAGEELTAIQVRTILNVADGATANATDAALRDRATHTGTQAAATISDFNASARAQVEAQLVAGTNITLTPAGAGATRTITIAAAGGGSGSPGGTNREVQFNNSGAFAGAANLEIDSAGNACIIPAAFDQAIPSAEAGNLKFFSRTKAGRSLLSVLGPSGLDVALQGHLGLNTVKMLKAVTHGATTLSNFGFPTATVTGTATAVAYANTNLFTRTIKVGYASAATAGSQTGLRTTNGSLSAPYIRFGREGFFVVIRFGLVATVADRQLFVGLTSDSLASAVADPSTYTRIIALGIDAADSNLHIMHNDATGTATKINLGADFPAPVVNQDFYELRLFQAAGTTTVGYYVENLHNGNKADGLITTDLPNVDVALTLASIMSNGATAAAVQIGINSYYCELDY